jgi:hypothetical protein
MKLKDLKEKLAQYPDDLEVLIYGDNIEDDFAIFKTSINHCTYTTKWQSEIDYYSFTEEICEYRDEVKGKITEGQIPMTKKDVLIIEV